MKKGGLALVLHAHLPYVRHPEYDSFLEENWLFEAITETYVPLINVFDGLERDGVDFSINMSISPPLLTMLSDELLQERYIRYIDSLISLSLQEIDRNRTRPDVDELAAMYHEHFLLCHKLFVEKYDRNLLKAFQGFMRSGKLEIISCCATHGFLPLLSVNKAAVRAQIEMGCRTHARLLGERPKGFWLPECGYEPGIEEELKKSGIEYFIVDTHGLLKGSPKPRNGVFAPVSCKNGVKVFGRDVETSQQVWSSKVGYPGAPVYRDFYRDIGFDLDQEYLDKYVSMKGIRHMTGIKYHRITSTGSESKAVYHRPAALQQASRDAEDFLLKRERQIDKLASLTSVEPIVVAPYDAELFGHWWFEGPDWLNFLLRKLEASDGPVESVTLSGYLKEVGEAPLSDPARSTWGYKGYSEYWLNDKNDWIYPHLHHIADCMEELANDVKNNDKITIRALNQAGREVLLAQSSDWAFIMKAGTMEEYASKRTKSHISRFNKLYEQIKAGSIDEEWLVELEEMDNIFPDMDFKLFNSNPQDHDTRKLNLHTT